VILLVGRWRALDIFAIANVSRNGPKPGYLMRGDFAQIAASTPAPASWRAGSFALGCVEFRAFGCLLTFESGNLARRRRWVGDDQHDLGQRLRSAVSQNAVTDGVRVRAGHAFLPARTAKG